MVLVFRPRFGVVHSCAIPRGRMEIGGRRMRSTLGPRRGTHSRPDLQILWPEPVTHVCTLPRGKMGLLGYPMTARATENRFVRITRESRLQLRGYSMRSQVDYDEQRGLDDAVGILFGLGL